MTQFTTDDTRIASLKEITDPQDLMKSYPATDAIRKTVTEARQAVSTILKGDDDRVIVVVGPCSIHDPKAAMEYAKKLQEVAKQHEKELLIIMRVYFEKPRTHIGWKGLINDPHMDQSFDINTGLKIARSLLHDIAQMGLPAGTEFLDTITPQYIGDLLTWGAIGARTTESQVHRQLTSGLSVPIGFKNGTDGNINIAVDAIRAARHPHHFLSVTKSGHTAIVETRGNEDCHIILRGSSKGPNFDEKSIIQTVKKLDAQKLTPKVMVDCSHGNSQKDYKRQSLVLQDIARQIQSGSYLISGVMIESNLNAGNQKLVPGQALEYGVSVTDACVDWSETTQMLDMLAGAVKNRRDLKNDNDALAQSRTKIDLIDQNIQDLLNQRIKEALEVAKIKKSATDTPALYRPERESAVIRAAVERNRGPITDEALESIFREIMNRCLEAED